MALLSINKKKEDCQILIIIKGNDLFRETIIITNTHEGQINRIQHRNEFWIRIPTQILNNKRKQIKSQMRRRKDNPLEEEKPSQLSRIQSSIQENKPNILIKTKGKELMEKYISQYTFKKEKYKRF